jgi:uncharacterized protein YqjF (DUF2071 family)
MTIPELLSSTSHRPWNSPTGNWAYYQEWNNAVFLHWEVDLHELQAFVPLGLEVDLFDGKPWVSVVTFDMERLRPRYLPSFPPISDFHEINVRTYVKMGTKTGVTFLSIEAAKVISCKIANVLSGLPYRYSKMSRAGASIISENAKLGERLNITCEVGEPLVEKTDIDRWLTERYALFQHHGPSINQFEIHHLEWPIHRLELKDIELDYRRFKNLIRPVPDLVHYSPGVQVVAWGKEKIQIAGH